MEAEEEVLARHRKEKKELQGKVTAMKHTAKNDKKKKKELTSEIERLESELKERHLLELRAVSSSAGPSEEAGPSLGEEPTEPPTDNLPKVSKAQKRREKKEAEERERERRVAAGEEEAKYGVRQQELDAMDSVLKARGLSLYEISPDGNCLYNAVAHQLALKSRESALDCTELRSRIAELMRRNPNDYLPFLTDEETGNTLTEEQFQAYCDKIARTTVWGGQPEIRALASVVKRPVEVVQASGAPIIVGEEFQSEEISPLVITYYRHAYGLGEHYNSTISQ